VPTCINCQPHQAFQPCFTADVHIFGADADGAVAINLYNHRSIIIQVTSLLSILGIYFSRYSLHYFIYLKPRLGFIAGGLICIRSLSCLTKHHTACTALVDANGG